MTLVAKTVAYRSTGTIDKYRVNRNRWLVVVVVVVWYVWVGTDKQR